jgi:hypothetical protein
MCEDAKFWLIEIHCHQRCQGLACGDIKSRGGYFRRQDAAAGHCDSCQLSRDRSLRSRAALGKNCQLDFSTPVLYGLADCTGPCPRILVNPTAAGHCDSCQLSRDRSLRSRAALGNRVAQSSAKSAGDGRRLGFTRILGHGPVGELTGVAMSRSSILTSEIASSTLSCDSRRLR